MFVAWGLIGVLLLIVWAITVYDIVRRHLDTKSMVAWLLIVLILPFIGAVLYWALRKPTADEIERGLDAGRDLRRGGTRSPYDSTPPAP